MAVVRQVSAGCERVDRATVRALGRAGFNDIQKDSGVHAPEWRFGAWAMQGQVVGSHGDRMRRQIAAFTRN